MAWTVAVLIVAAVAVGPLAAIEIAERQTSNNLDVLLINTNELNDAHHFNSNAIGHIIPRKAGCKAKDLCIVMGGSCVTNAKRCGGGGRLVPGCKGKNCQCCVPETNSQNLEQKLETMQDNLTNSISNMLSKLTNANSKLNVELQTLKDNLTDDNAKFSKDFHSMSDNLNDSISNMVSKLDYYFPSNFSELHDVDFSNSGGTAHATGGWWSNGYIPMNAYRHSSDSWIAGKPYTVPKSVWFEFPKPIRVMKYSFATRNDCCQEDGASKYRFWGSNAEDCSDETKWDILRVDDSGRAFTSSLTTKTEDIQNRQSYKCYGFKVTDVPGRGGYKFVSIRNVHYFAIP